MGARKPQGYDEVFKRWKDTINVRSSLVKYHQYMVYISENTDLRGMGKMGSFLRPTHVRDFVKKGTFLYPGTKYGGQNPLTIPEIYAALTPSDLRSDSASEFAAATCCR